MRSRLPLVRAFPFLSNHDISRLIACALLLLIAFLLPATGLLFNRIPRLLYPIKHDMLLLVLMELWCLSCWCAQFSYDLFGVKAQGSSYRAAVVEHSPAGPDGSSSTQDEANAFKATNLEAYLVSIYHLMRTVVYRNSSYRYTLYCVQPFRFVSLYLICWLLVNL